MEPNAGHENSSAALQGQDPGGHQRQDPAGHQMSLAALQRQDPFIQQLLDVSGQVALYNFNSKTNEWEKTEIEGTLFVYARAAAPHHGFTIMNRLSTENLVEPINKDLEFQLQDPFLLYRNGSLGIYSIWFYDKKDCQRIAQLMVRIVKQEADHAQRESPERAEPQRTNGVAEPRSIDILELLSKAKEEYQRAKTGDTDSSAELNKSVTHSVSEPVPSASQPEKISHPVVKQITVEELFGSPLPKDPSLPLMPSHSAPAAPSDPSAAFLQSQAFPPAAHQIPLLPRPLAAQDPGSTPLLPFSRTAPGPGLLPTVYRLQPSPGLPAAVSRSDPQPLCSVSPLLVPSAAPEPPPAAPPAGPAGYLGQEILSTLKPASVGLDPHKPILAPSFLPSALFPPHSFQEPAGKPLLPLSKDRGVFSQPPHPITSMSAVSLSPALAVPGSDVSVLLSPSAFQQSLNKTAAAAAAAAPAAAASAIPAGPSESSSTPGAAAEPAAAAPCTRAQLQETLIHLIKNDPDFLGAIHEAYLQTVSQDFSSMKL